MSVAMQEKTALQLLEELRQAGISLSTDDGEKLQLVASPGMLDQEVLEAVREHKAGLLELLKDDRVRDTLRNVDLRPVDLRPEERYMPFPLTDRQRACWVGRQNAVVPGDVAMHFYTEVDARSLDIKRLERAWNKVVARHDMLRAVVNVEGEQQVLETVRYYRIEVDDLGAFPRRDRETALQALRTALSHGVRETGAWPGFSIRVARLNNGNARIFVGIDLLHVDNASLFILFDDWSRFYGDEGLNPEPPALAWRDYVLAEARLKDSARYREDLAYWRAEVKKLPPPPSLPIVAGAVGTRVERKCFEICAADHQRLRDRAAALGVTPTILAMVAFSEIIRHWSREPSFTLNITLFNRLPVHPEVIRVVGDFTSTVLLGIDHRETETLAQQAVRLQSRLWSHLEHGTVSGVTVLGELNAHLRSGSANMMPVRFTSLLDLREQGFPMGWLDRFGEPVCTLAKTPQVSLDHQLREQGDGSIAASWDYMADMFPAGRVDAMFDAYRVLLAELLSGQTPWRLSPPGYTPQDQLPLFHQVNEAE